MEVKKIVRAGKKGAVVYVPKGWLDFFNLEVEDLPVKVETVTDLPFVVFPPQITDRKSQTEALKKIIILLETAPDRFPDARKGRKKKR
ncbi:MAG: hypothetical protein GH150_04655 [Hadesarchaea archaeon]|nr:hypothetical protein [Hadesarchaea archaeon]